ncbi:hypothetical protein CCP3SC1_600002 [Gammaproteobacteria bacterium]
MRSDDSKSTSSGEEDHRVACTQRNPTAKDNHRETDYPPHLEAELRITPKKIQASNKELLAANERLKECDEELQSVRAELSTVNAERVRKTAELAELSNDLNNLLACAEVGTVFLDQELRIRRVSPGVVESLNLLPGDVGRRIDAFNLPLEYPDLLDSLRRVQESRIDIDREVRDSRGRWYFLRVRSHRSMATSAEVILSLMDITRLKSAEDRVQADLRRRDEFLAMLSHELRNPLAAIMNATHTLRQWNQLAAVPCLCTDIIDRQATHMTRLLDDLLDVSRLTQNKFKLRRSVFDLRTVVPDAVQAVNELLTKRRVHLSVALSEEPLWIDADPVRLQQVVVNLLNNAIKYNHAQGEVWLTLGSEQGKRIVRVRDNGIGIPDGLLESVFDSFVQGEQGLDRAEGGIGVGLTLVRHITQLHDGTVTAYSEGLGYGAEFLITLPQVPAPK